LNAHKNKKELQFKERVHLNVIKRSSRRPHQCTAANEYFRN